MPTVGRAVQSFVASEAGDLALAVGDLVTVLDKAADGWWTGWVDGRQGLFPGNFIEIVDPQKLASPIEEVLRPPPAAIRFAYNGANTTEGAVLHGLAAAYEGLFRLQSGRLMHGKPTYRHVSRPDKWVAFNGRGWMGQAEGMLGGTSGVLLLSDTKCQTPDLSDASWKVTPGWKTEPGLRCIGMSELEMARWEEESNPWGEAAASNDALAVLTALQQVERLGELPPDQQAALMQKLAALGLDPQAVRVHEGGGSGTRLVPRLNRPGASWHKHAAAQPREELHLPGDMVYRGALNSDRKPHGIGELLLRDSSAHVGLFEAGVAHGEGVYYDCKGAVHFGSWVTNHRVGAFEVVDAKGAMWDDTYDQWGKRVARKCSLAPGKLPQELAARHCAHCSARFHVEHNYRCRGTHGMHEAAA